MPRKAPAGAQSVLRAIALLKAFTLERPERDVAGLASETGLSRATVHRLLAALESEGLVARATTPGRYRLGPSAATLGVRALRSSALRETARPELGRLAAETGESATLEVLAEGKMLILDEVLGPRLIGASPSLGTAWALHATSTGKAVLAALPRARVRDLLAGGRLKSFTAGTLANRRALESELDAIRKRGFAIAREELEAGYSAVGAVIPIPMETEARAALSVGGPSERLDEDRLEELGRRVRTGADDVAAKLGYERPS